MKDIFIIVPTLNPNIDILEVFLKELKKEFKNILVFDDGCREEYKDFFEKLEKEKIIVLHHYINLGKGRAMKDAFNYLLNEYPNLKGVVTADSDGQHSVKDIKKMAEMLLEHDDCLILGCRNFENKSVPTRNKFGNKITRKAFKTLIGLKITDTQTGLRGLPKKVMIKFLTTKGDRFEYETNQLIDTIEKNVPIKEIPIETIYLKNSNSESHFNPIKDSFNIYKIFLKYILSSITSFIFDYLFFALLFYIIIPEVSLKYAISFMFARIFSSIINFIINSKLVFKSKHKSSKFKYFILVVVQMIIGSLIGNLFSLITNIPVIIIKIIIDVIIFMVNFVIQREFIFIEEKHEKK